MCITHNWKSIWRYLQQEDKGKLCIVIHAKINYISGPANMFEANAKLPTGIFKDYGLGVNFAICPKN